MDDRERRARLLAILPTILKPPPEHLEDIKELITCITAVLLKPPSPDTETRFRLFSSDVNSYAATEDPVGKEKLSEVEHDCAYNDGSMIAILQTINENVSSLQYTLANHMAKTDRYFDQIRDEICCIKRQMSCANEHTNRQINDVEETAKSVKINIDKNHVVVMHRIQSVSDAIKQAPVPVRTHTQQTTTDVLGSVRERREDAQEVRELPRKVKTLIIEDSIVNGIQRPGLGDDVEIH
ncbi:hypothetical protein ACF0H5_009423 [Mactra antiquata]